MSKASILRQAILEIVHEHAEAGMLPTSARFIYYELIAREIISKEKTGARRTDQDMIDALTWLRENGHIPWRHITDETRELSDYTGDPPMIITKAVPLLACCVPLLSNMWCASPRLMGNAQAFSTMTLPRHFDAEATFIIPKPVAVIYLGDNDFSGNHIEAVLEREVGWLGWERLAVTDEQVTEFGLTVIDKYDARTKGYHDAVETEALGQARIIEIVRSRLDELLPESLEAVHEREEAERREISDLLSD